MSMLGKDFIDVARRLLVQTELEADYRSAASRAYYAAFHEADAALPADFAPSEAERRGKSSHEIIIDACRTWGNSLVPGRDLARQISRDLARLKRTRRDADYLLSQDFSKDQAVDAVLVADTLCQRAHDAQRKHSAA